MSIHRISTEELIERVPMWCHTGALVRVSEDLFEDEEERIGLIIDLVVVCVEDIPDEQYQDLLEHEEWLLIDVSIDNGILHHLFQYSLSPVTLKIKIENNNAKI